jgi:putative glutamine amidotransferase
MVIGGEDLAAEVSGAAPEAIGDNADAARDRWDVTLLSAALETGVRVLAICCRGMQLLNVAFGGSLYGHMTGSSPELPPVPHDLTAALDFRHGVVLAPRSRIRAATGVKVIETNSLNHQFVDRLGDGLVVIGVAADGVGEAVEPATATWWVGVQWHPELRADDAAQRALVEEFVDTCRAGREQHPGGLSPRRLPTTTGRAS